MGISVWFLMLLGIQSGVLQAKGADTSAYTRPGVVNIGAIFPFNSTIGKVAKVAILAALDDVNSDPDVLGGTKLNITMKDCEYSRFLGIVEAMQFMERDTVAIIGPQSSAIAHVVSHISNELQVPLLSFASTDPSLSSLEYPFFVRTTQSDLYQMAAIADIIDYFMWKEVVVVYVDDEFGRNGIAALGDKLAEKHSKISYSAAMDPNISREDITSVLAEVASTESRIIVLHVYNSNGLEVLDVAKFLGMMGSGYVWFATNWLTDIIDTYSPLSSEDTELVQGVITLRMHTPDTQRKRNFVSRWRNLTLMESENGPLGLNAFGLYAYDTVWLLARALGTYFDQGGKVSFSADPNMKYLQGGGSLHLDAMSIFEGGNQLLQNILQANLTGLTGLIKFDTDKNLIHPAFEILNVIGSGHKRIGYWSNYSGLSVRPPEDFYSRPANLSSSSQKLSSVVWPGQTVEKPRGWVLPNNGRRLRIGVPNRVSYHEFIAYSPSTAKFSGYCIDVFTAAVNLLPYPVPYDLLPYGDGTTNPSPTGLIESMLEGSYDAAIGDIAITTNRTKIADFTQPYIDSGLVVVVPIRKLNTNEWAFLRPFTPMMWFITTLFFLFLGVVVWLLEHRINNAFRGPPRKQIVTSLSFSFSTLFFTHKEKPNSTMCRVVLIIWLFAVLIIKSTYTASLTSMLTVQQLFSPIKGIESLQASNDPIGYQRGSFASTYLSEELGIHKSRLIPLNSIDDYARALHRGPKNGGVAAIVDEKAYMKLFLSTRCEFTMVGEEFTKTGWGYAFPRDSPLAVDMTTVLLKLSENGELQRIHDKWLKGNACISQGSKLSENRMELKSFWGLFLMCAFVCLLSLLVYFYITVKKFMKHYHEEGETIGRQATPSQHLIRFLSFVDEKDVEIEGQSRRRKIDNSSNEGSARDASVHCTRETNTDIASGTDTCIDITREAGVE